MSEFESMQTAPAIRDFARQGAVYDGLMHTLEEGTFVHAYLISGAAGVGKRSLAHALEQYFLCTGEDKPCGECPACVQVRDGNHPDLMILRPEKSAIRVDDVREIIRKAGEHTYEGGRRVIRVEQAEKMNAAAQNCLLKTLEEPVEGTIFLLLTDTPGLLLPTIISRCRALKLHPWPDEVVLNALRRHGMDNIRAQEALHVAAGSIGRALSVAADEGYWQRRSEVMRDFFAPESRSDILRISGQWKDRREQSGELLDDVEDMLRTLLMVRLGQRDASAAADYPAPWRKMAEGADIAVFSRLMDDVHEARRLRGSQVTWQAVVEKLLLRLMEERSQWST